MNPNVLKKDSDFQVMICMCSCGNEVDCEDQMSVFTFQDLPEHFEDNIKIWMDNFLQLLSADNKLLKTEVCVAQQKYFCSFTQACALLRI